jgi:glycosyltransferase involved in cell wall biosynthesis
LAQEVVQSATHKLNRPLELVTLWDVAPERVPLYMNACDAMLMLSLREGSPNVVKEAMACDLPVVSVPVGDVAELLGGIAGNHVRSYEAEDLAEALVGVLTENVPPGGRSAIISRGLDLNGVAQRILNIYETVLKKHAFAEGARHVLSNSSAGC